MTASEEAKAAGLPSLEWAARQIGKPSQTLRNWHRDSHALFIVVIYGLKHVRTIFGTITIKRNVPIEAINIDFQFVDKNGELVQPKAPNDDGVIGDKP